MLDDAARGSLGVQGLAVQEGLVQLVVDVAPFHQREVLSQHFETSLRVAAVSHREMERERESSEGLA